VTWKPYIYSGDFAYVKGHPVLAAGCGVAILKTSATNGNIFFYGEEEFCLGGYLGFELLRRF
jgi:hypothetical protein